MKSSWHAFSAPIMPLRHLPLPGKRPWHICERSWVSSMKAVLLLEVLKWFDFLMMPSKWQSRANFSSTLMLFCMFMRNVNIDWLFLSKKAVSHSCLFCCWIWLQPQYEDQCLEGVLLSFSVNLRKLQDLTFFFPDQLRKLSCNEKCNTEFVYWLVLWIFFKCTIITANQAILVRKQRTHC